MAPPVFCCQCGDGPYNLSVVVACASCGHNFCGYCMPETEYWAHENVAALPTQQLTSHASGHSTQNTLSYNAHFHHAAVAPNLGFSGDNNGVYSAPYNQHPKYPPNWRWKCCNCGNNNSVKTDLGCANCCNHWRNSCCTVWDAAN